jgi:hypothetical protein
MVLPSRHLVRKAPRSRTVRDHAPARMDAAAADRLGVGLDAPAGHANTDFMEVPAQEGPRFPLIGQ